MPATGELPAIQGAGGERGGGTFRSMRLRNFRLFFGGQLISQIGNWLTLIAQTLLVLKLTDSGVALGLLAASQFAPVLVIGPWAGLIADRSDKRKLLLIVQAFAMVQSFVLAAIAFMDRPPIVAIYVVAVFGGIATAFDNPARRAFVVEMVPPEDVQNAVSLNSALMTGSRIIGPALAGLLISTVGYGWCFAIDGVSYVAVLAGLWLMRPSELRSPPVSPRGKGQVRAGLRYAWGMAELRVPLVMMAVIGTLTFNFNVVLPLLVRRTLDGDDNTFTLVYSVLSAGSLVGALVSARRTTIAVRHVAWSAMAFGISMLLLAVTPNLAFTFPIGLLVGVTSIAFMTSSTAIVQVRADPSMRGRVLALQAMVFLGSTPIGGPIVGAVSELLGPRVGVLIGGLAACAAGVYGWLAARTESPAASEPVALR
ncbi:MAG: MFS transporter [Acidimicrobiia bacterium]